MLATDALWRPNPRNRYSQNALNFFQVSEEVMERDNPTMKKLRIELSNLRDDLAVIESSDVFSINAIGNQEAVNAIRDRIAEIESILARNDK